MPSYLFDFLIVSDFISSKYEQPINNIFFVQQELMVNAEMAMTVYSLL